MMIAIGWALLVVNIGWGLFCLAMAGLWSASHQWIWLLCACSNLMVGGCLYATLRAA